MFEKEAEECTKDIYIHHFNADVIHHFDDDVIYPNVLKAITMGVQKGAEFGYKKANEWHKLDWDKAEEHPDVDKLVRVRTRSGTEYICETYSYFPTEDEIGYGSVITLFAELNGDWVDDNEIEYWCYIEPFKESE